MIQKKVCMVGVHGTGKTSLVQRYVHSIFSAKYHSTVGVKIDRKQVTIGETPVNLLLWDIEGRTDDHDIPPSYLRGAHAVFYVADGTRRVTVDQLHDLRSLVQSAAGDVPSVVALNKADLSEQWTIDPGAPATLEAAGFQTLRTSARTGDGVEEAFRRLAAAAIGMSQTTQPASPPPPPATRP